MTIREHYRAQWQAVKAKSPRERRAYFMQYYALPLAALLAALIFVGILLGNFLSKKDPGLFGVFMNVHEEADLADYMEGFAVQQGIDTQRAPMETDTSIFITGSASVEGYGATEKLLALIASHTADTIAGPYDVLSDAGYQNYLADLRDFLDDATLETYAGRIVYIDGAILAGRFEDDGDPLAAIPSYPNPFAPEAMEDPIPVGITLNPDCALCRTLLFIGSNPTIAITGTTNRPDSARAFLLYALES